jgi:multiple sugar transport system substrate-binding protein
MTRSGMKRAVALLGAGVLLGVAGCSSDAETTTTGGGGAVSGGDQQTIRVIAAQYTDAMQPYYDDLVERFEADNPDIKVNVEVVSWNDIDQVLATMVTTNDLPDIGNLNYFSSFAADGLLYEASEIVSPAVLDDMIDVFMDNSKYNGVAYAVPDLASARLFFYNADIFEQVGLTADDIATWDGVRAAAQKIKEELPDITPIALPLGPEEAQAEFLIWASSNDGGVYENGEWTITSDANVETLEFLSGLVADGLTNPSPATFNRTDGAFALFAEGQAAMLNGAIFLPSVLADSGSEVNYAVAPFPTNRADGRSITLGVQDYFFGFKKDGNQEAIQRFLTFLFEPDNYAGFLEAAGGFLPATVSAGEKLSADETLAPYIEVLPNAVFYPGSEATWPAVQGEIQQTIGTAVLPGADIRAILANIATRAE